MAEITKPATSSMCTDTPPNNCKLGDGLLAGEAIAVGDACYIKSDGLVWLATGAAANAAARVRGFAAKPAAAGEPITIMHAVNFGYVTGAALGADLYLSGTVPGGLADAASTGGTSPIAFVVDANRIRVLGLK